MILSLCVPWGAQWFHTDLSALHLDVQHTSAGYNETSLAVTIHGGFLCSFCRLFHSESLAYMIHLRVATALSLVHPDTFTFISVYLFWVIVLQFGLSWCSGPKTLVIQKLVLLWADLTPLFHRHQRLLGQSGHQCSFSSRVNPLPPSAWICSTCGSF